MSFFERMRSGTPRRPRTMRLEVEALERRDVPATLTVNSNLDVIDHSAGDTALTLREAIAAVTAGNSTGLSVGELTQITGAFGSSDTILLTGLAGQTITLGGSDINIGKSVTITGPGADQLTISGNDQSRILYVNPGITVTITSVTLADGNADGGDDGQGGGVAGGAIFSDNSLVYLTGVTLRDNAANQAGGAFANVFGSANLTNCTITNNTSVNGGAFFNINDTEAESLILTGCTVSGNIATNRGGAFYHISGGAVDIRTSTLSGNQATAAGGAVYAEAKLLVTASTFTNNTSGATGGALAVIANTATITNADFESNHAVSAGGAVYGQGNVVLSGSLFNANSSDDSGGGLALNSSLTTVCNTTFTANTANGSGGAIFNQGFLTLSTTTIVGNTANSASAANTSFTGGGLATVDTGTVSSTLFNTLVAGNKAGTALSDIAGRLVSSASMNNLVATIINGLTHGTNGNLVGNEGIGTRPLAAIIQLNGDGTPKLADNGGLTKTVALAAGSAAINAGSAAVDSLVKTTDQRGANFPRQIAALDIGAFEAINVVDNASDVDDGNYSAGNLSLREAIKLANLGQSADVIAIALPGQTITLTGGEYSLTTPITLTGSSVTLQRSSGTGRIFNVAAGVAATLSGLTITGGNTSADGGGILNAGTLTLVNSVVSGNAAQNGGGIRNTGTLTLVRSTVSGNTAAAAGGGVSSTGTLTSTNGTFASNVAAAFGGGLANSGTATIVSNTFAANSAGTNGGAISTTTGATTTLHNSLVAGNTVLGSPGDLGDQPIAGGGSGNLISDSASSGGLVHGTNGNIVGNNGAGAIALAAVLETNANGTPKLVNNGGVTPTIALAQNSLAIGAALAAAPGAVNYDQREAARDETTPDIGAYEVQHPLSPVGAPSTQEDTFLPSPSINTTVAFIRGLYRLTLLRDADYEGLKGWANQMSLGATRTQVAYGFTNSYENRSSQVTFFYRYFLHRGPDAAGLAGWVDVLQKGSHETFVVAGFLLSPEFTGQNSNASFVNLMYFAVLGRQADAAGFAGWTSQLDSGQLTRNQVGDGFLRSVEGISRVISTMYGSYLKRYAPQDDLDYYVVHVGEGLTFGQSAALILGSEEFFLDASQNLN